MAHAATRHFSIIDVTITDEFIERRTKAANAAATRWRKLPTAGAALDKASMLAEALIEASTGGAVPASLRQEVGGDINRNAPTHDPQDASKDFEVAVIASVAAIILLEGTATRSEHCAVFAEALSAAMDISAAKGAPRVADLWDELSRAARMVGDGTAEKRRARRSVDPSDPSAAIVALADNARKDGEEINILWWTLNDWSTLAGARLSGLPVADGTVAAAIELAEMLSWPAVRAHRQLAHRNLSDHDSDLALSQLAITGAPLRSRIDATLASVAALVTTHPRVFVALTAVNAADPATAAAALQAAGIDGGLAKTAWRWCERLVRELSLAMSAGGTLGSIE